ncbi:hypothetical protein [Cribrihabitans neustonicus]|uniref:hypothetical protein n=1 Tax=Cribrihabitans neustonicus TaxID=1429085 RepID=UPI003B5909B2
MADLTLTKVRFRNGIWEGRLSNARSRPEITVMHRDHPLEGIALAEGERGEWHLSVPVPADALGDGTQTFVIFDSGNAARLGAFTVTGSSTEDAGLRAEVELLRAELDMLKRAFRRHCRDTA